MKNVILISYFLLSTIIGLSQNLKFGVGFSCDAVIGIDFKNTDIYKTKTVYSSFSGVNWGVNLTCKKNKIIYSLNVNHRVIEFYKDHREYHPMADIEILDGQYKTGVYKDGSYYGINAGQDSYSSIYSYYRTATLRMNQTNLSVNFTYQINNSNLRIGSGVMLNVNHNFIEVFESIKHYQNFNLSGENYTFNSSGGTKVKTIEFNNYNLSIPIIVDFTHIYNELYITPYYSLNLSKDVTSLLGFKLGWFIN